MEFLQQLADLDLESRAVLVFAVALGGLLFGIAGRWRQILREAPVLPFWEILGRAGIRPGVAAHEAGSRAIRNAELRCMLCAERTSCCTARAKADAPPEGCPMRISCESCAAPAPGSAPAVPPFI